MKGKGLENVSPRLWNDYSSLTVLDLSENPKLGEAGIPDEFALMANLKSLRLSQCGLSKLPVGMLSSMTELQTLELAKNSFKTFFDDENIKRSSIKLQSLTYINLNSNQLTEIPPILQHFTNLKQLHMHMNKITSANILCRDRFNGLEVIDFGSNKLMDIPVALPKFLLNLT